MTSGSDDHRDGDPFACTPLDAAVCAAGLMLSGRYALSLARLGQEAMWGASSEMVFWAGLLGAPLAVMAPAWLLGRLTPVNPVWLAIGLATPPTIWAVWLGPHPLALLLVGTAAVATALLTILPARQGQRLRARSIHRRGRCPGCGYSLEGLDRDICPECGRRA